MRSARSNTITAVAGAVELLGGGEPGRAGADHRDLLARAHRRRLRGAPSPRSKARSMIETSTALIVTGVVVDAEHARALARRRAQPAGELREVVGRVQALDRVAPVVAVDEVVPVGDDVAERAALVAERDAAVHAARRLLLAARRSGKGR